MQTFSRKGESDVILCQLNTYFLKKSKRGRADETFHFEAVQLSVLGQSCEIGHVLSVISKDA